MMSSKIWVQSLFLILLSIGISVGIFNYNIDPYGYFSSHEKYVKTLTRIAKPKILNIKLYTSAQMYLIGTSRQRRVNPQLIESLTGYRTQNVNITGSTLSENYLLAKKLKTLKKNFIFGFDCTSLNRYRVENFAEITNRYLTYKEELTHTRYPYASLFDADITLQSIQYLTDKHKHIAYDQIEKHENAQHYAINPKVLVGAVDGSNKKSSYSAYTAYSDETVRALAKLATKEDVFVIFPKYIGWYKMFHTYQDIEAKYFHAISVLVKNTKAKVWIFYGKNSITVNADNFDTNGWHFKPRIAKKIFAKVYGKNITDAEDDFGHLLTIKNVDSVLTILSERLNYNTYNDNQI